MIFTERCLKPMKLVERPDPTAEEIFGGIQAEAARVSETPPDFPGKRYLFNEIAELCKKYFALFKAYQVLFDHNEKANERIEEGDRQLDELAEIVSEQTDKIRYLEAMREPCCKREEDDEEGGWHFSECLCPDGSTEVHPACKLHGRSDDGERTGLSGPQIEYFAQMRERAREGGWLGNYEAATYCTED